jgi:putative phosphoribosyl transferase
VFADRIDAGRRLANRLTRFAGLGPVVVGMPRGGVPVAAQVADHLGAPLDVIVVRKLGCPWQPELGIGALAEGDVRVLNGSLIAEVGVSPAELAAVTEREQAELARRVALYRRGRAPVDVQGRLVILIDDGLATGFTARAAIAALRHRGARRVVMAVPVGPESGVAAIREVADEVEVLDRPAGFLAIGECYEDFNQTSDAEVIGLLGAAPRFERGAAPARGTGGGTFGSASAPVEGAPVRCRGGSSPGRRRSRARSRRPSAATMPGS